MVFFCACVCVCFFGVGFDLGFGISGALVFWVLVDVSRRWRLVCFVLFSPLSFILFSECVLLIFSYR